MAVSNDMEKNRWLWDQGQIDDDEKEETVLMQKAVASVVTSDEFQGLMKKVVKVALDERTQEENQRALAWEIARGKCCITYVTRGLEPHAAWIETRHRPRCSRAWSHARSARQSSNPTS